MCLMGFYLWKPNPDRLLGEKKKTRKAVGEGVGCHLYTHLHSVAADPDGLVVGVMWINHWHLLMSNRGDRWNPGGSRESCLQLTSVWMTSSWRPKKIIFERLYFKPQVKVFVFWLLQNFDEINKDVKKNMISNLWPSFWLNAPLWIQTHLFTLWYGRLGCQGNIER